MKTEVNINFDASDIPGGAQGVLAAIGCSPDAATIKDIPILKRLDVWIQLDDTDDRVAKLLALLEQYETSYLLGRNDVFTEEESQNARLLRMSRDVNVNIFSGPRLGTKYDMVEACTVCGTGARQISPLYVNVDDFSKIRKHRAIGSYYRDILVDGGIAKKLIDDRVSGISFGEVYAHQKNKKRDLVAREQVIVSHTMPPLSPKSTVVNRDDMCPCCRRGGLNSTMGVPFRLAYRAQDLTDIQDFNLSWEWFGPYAFGGHVDQALFASPEVLVTPKVMNIFRDAGVKTFSWTPVFIDE
jgi:hypothetical protein